MNTKAGLTIFVKLLGVFVILIVFIGAVWLGLLVIFYQRIQIANQAQTLALQINAQTLQARRYEKNFQLRDLDTAPLYENGEVADLTNQAAAVTSLKTFIDQLEKLNALHDPGTVENLRASVNAYQTSFTSLVDAYRRAGARSWGLKGQWTGVANSLEQELAAVRNNKDITISYLALRRDEKNYLLRGDAAYVTAVGDDAAGLEHEIRAVGEPLRTSLLSDLSAYTDNFQQYLKVQNEIGITETEGLQGDMRTAINKVEPMVVAIVVETQKLVARQTQQATQAADPGDRYCHAPWSRDLRIAGPRHILAYRTGGARAGGAGGRRPHTRR